MPKNDHSIVPGSAIVERAYRDYAPLFDAMHGARWLLTARPASVEPPSGTRNTTSSSASGPFVNIFTSGSGEGDDGGRLPMLLVTVMLGAEHGTDAANTTVLTLNLGPTVSALGWPVVEGASVGALYPRSGSETALGEAVSLGRGEWQVHVPLVRGCALVRVRLRGKRRSPLQ